jgi:uncharacterized protein (TIGR00645 family)
MKTKKLIEKIIFDSKVILIVFYFGLIIGMCCYAWVYFKQVYHLMIELNEFTKDSIMLALLELVDMVMIAWLVRSIITGSYNSAITKDHGFAGENITSGLLKVKMSTSIISVSIILMLQSYINASNVSWDFLLKKSLIHCIFLITGVVLAYAEYLHDLGDSINPHDTDGIHEPKNKEENHNH